MRTMQLAVGVALAFAAASSAGGQSIGVKGGWVHSTVTGRIDSGASGLDSFGGGAFLEVPVSPVFALQAEVLRVPKGAIAESGGVRTSFTVNYMEVPVLAKATIALHDSSVKPNVFAGPYLAFKGSCKMESSGIGAGSALSCGDANSQLNDTDAGLAFGGGIAFPLTERVGGLVEARYDLGLKRIDQSTAGSDVKNRSFMLFAGVSIPVGPRRGGTTLRTTR